MQTVAEIEAAIAKLPSHQQWEIAKWLEETLRTEETPAMLSALAEGFRSSKTELFVPREDVRRRHIRRTAVYILAPLFSAF